VRQKVAGSLNKAKKQYETGKYAQAAGTLAGARVEATRQGDTESIAVVNDWIAQLGGPLGGADRQAFDAEIAKSDTFLQSATQTATKKADKAAEEVDVSPAGLVLGGLGAAAMIIAVFLPYADTSSLTFFRIEKNTLIQNGGGWVFIIAGVVGALRVYTSYRSRKRTWAPVIAGGVGIGYAVYFGSNGGDSLKFCSVLTGTNCQVANPGTGVYLAGVGGLLMVVGGLAILSSKKVAAAGRSVETAPAVVTSPDPGATKTCPDCAETVLDAARVCKHCGYRFAEAVETPQG
jgi:hypothetical protein